MSKQAFPRPYYDQPGMTLLEYYAGQALIGLWAACAHPQSDAPTQWTFDIGEKSCVKQAEVMVKEAEKRSNS